MTSASHIGQHRIRGAEKGKNILKWVYKGIITIRTLVPNMSPR